MSYNAQKRKMCTEIVKEWNKLKKESHKIIIVCTPYNGNFAMEAAVDDE